MSNVVDISIIIPVYNTPKHLLSRAVQSARSQTGINSEIIIVDDGSIKECAKQCDEIANKYSNVITVHQRNTGVSGARNTGLRVARGEWIAFLDPDDELVNDSLFTAIAVAKENSVDILYTTVVDIDGERVSCRSFCFENDSKLKIIDSPTSMEVLRAYFLAYETIDKKTVPKSLSTASWARIFNKRIASLVSFNTKLKILEDALFNYEAATLANKVAFLDTPSYKYYRYGSSAMGNISLNSDFDNHCRVMKDFVIKNNIKINYYYSNILSYAFIAWSVLAKHNKLTYRYFINSCHSPYISDAARCIDINEFEYSSKVASIKYRLLKHNSYKVLFILLISYNVLKHNFSS